MAIRRLFISCPFVGTNQKIKNKGKVKMDSGLRRNDGVVGGPDPCGKTRLPVEPPTPLVGVVEKALARPSNGGRRGGPLWPPAGRIHPDTRRARRPRTGTGACPYGYFFPAGIDRRRNDEQSRIAFVGTGRDLSLPLPPLSAPYTESRNEAFFNSPLSKRFQRSPAAGCFSFAFLPFHPRFDKLEVLYPPFEERIRWRNSMVL